MSQGKVVAIYVGSVAHEPLQAREAVRAVASRGLEGDRYFQGEETAPAVEKADQNVTLIESEALEALLREEGVTLEAAESRRNIVTQHVALNHLVGRYFRVGEVLLRGVRLCEPCSHLQKMTRPGVLKGLVHRGGLRAEILTDGELHVGDPVEVP